LRRTTSTPHFSECRAPCIWAFLSSLKNEFLKNRLEVKA
jgi:hypothetical protein